MDGADSLDMRQQHTFDALTDRSERLAEIYRAAVEAMMTPAAAGLERARVSIVCHCMRELMNGLPAVMADSSIPRPDPSANSLLSRLPKVVAAHPALDLTLEQDLIPVPRDVATAIAQLVTTANLEHGRNRSIAASLVTGATDAMHPAVTQWRNAQDFFLGWTHLDRNHTRMRELPSDDDLWSNIHVVEDVIDVRSALFFDNLHALQDLLAEANATDEGAEK